MSKPIRKIQIKSNSKLSLPYLKIYIKKKNISWKFINQRKILNQTLSQNVKTNKTTIKKKKKKKGKKKRKEKTFKKVKSEVKFIVPNIEKIEMYLKIYKLKKK